MKVALVHDYLREFGGAERVLEVLHELYPQAPLFTSFVDWKSLGEHTYRFKSWDIRTHWIGQNPIMKRLHSPLRFMAPLIWERFDLRGYDVVISSSGWFMCRGVVTHPETLHISYIHHPPRNLYGYPTGSKKRLLTSVYAGFINPFLRMYDFFTAQRVDVLVANSQETKRRIQKYYRRDTEVIYPPVNVDHPFVHTEKQDYFLSVGRLNYAKRIDLAIDVCNELKLPLKIVGVGKEEENLKRRSGPTIHFEGGLSDEELQKMFKYARGLIFTALEEDFGMVPVEAMSWGTPVIALKQGGVQETVVEGETGTFFTEPSISSLSVAMKKFIKNESAYSQEKCYHQAQKFSKEIFTQQIEKIVAQHLKKR